MPAPGLLRSAPERGRGVSIENPHLFRPCVGCPFEDECISLGEGCGAHWDSWRARARLEHMRAAAPRYGCTYCHRAAGEPCLNPKTGEPLETTAAHQVRLGMAGLGILR